MLTYEESVIAYLRQNRTGTRREIARFLGVSTVKAGQTVDFLLENHFFLQKPKVSDARGRRAGILSLSDEILLPVLDMTGDVFSLRLMTLSGQCADERPFLHNRYFTREENAAAFIRNAALYLKRRLPNPPFRCAAILTPFSYYERSFADYCSEDLIRHQLAALMPGWTTLLCNDAEAGAAALSIRSAPRPDALIAIKSDRAFAAFPNGREPLDLSAYFDNGQSLVEIFAENNTPALSAFFAHAALFLAAERFLVDRQGKTLPTPAGGKPLLIPLPTEEQFYTFGASLLLLKQLIITATHCKGDS